MDGKPCGRHEHLSGQLLHLYQMSASQASCRSGSVFLETAVSLESGRVKGSISRPK